MMAAATTTADVQPSKKRARRHVGFALPEGEGDVPSKQKTDQPTSSLRLVALRRKRGSQRTTFDADNRDIATLLTALPPANDTATTPTTQRPWFRAPLYQRRYCWSNHHWRVLWDDVKRMVSEHADLKPAAAATAAAGTAIGPPPLPPSDGSSGGASTVPVHSLGRILVSRAQPSGKSQRCVVVDGQQRVTSLLLLLAALRDAALQAGTTPLLQLALDCNTLLFRGGTGLAHPASPTTATTTTTATQQAASALPGPPSGATPLPLSLTGEGAHELAKACAWTPTFLDCLAFVKAVAWPAHATIATTTTTTTTTATTTTAAATTTAPPVSAVMHAKSYFVTQALAEPPAALRGIVRAVVYGLGVTVLTLRLGDAQTAFESMSRGAEAGHLFFPLAVPRAGRALASSDLIRNLVLGLYMAAPRQHKAYTSAWIPLECAAHEWVGKHPAAKPTVAPPPPPPPRSASTEGDEDDSSDDDTPVIEEDATSGSLDAFFLAFMREVWGVKDPRKVQDMVLLHRDMEVAYPAFSTEVRRRLAAFKLPMTTHDSSDTPSSAAASGAGGGAGAGASASASAATGAQSALEDDKERVAAFADNLIHQLANFANSAPI